MITVIFESIIKTLKSIAPMSVAVNIVIGIILLVLGLTLLSQKFQQTKRKRIGGCVCISVSILAFLGSLSTWIFTYVVFAYILT